MDGGDECGALDVVSSWRQISQHRHVDTHPEIPLKNREKIE